jgi:hypothetical protein
MKRILVFTMLLVAMLGGCAVGVGTPVSGTIEHSWQQTPVGEQAPQTMIVHGTASRLDCPWSWHYGLVVEGSVMLVGGSAP